MHNAPSMSKTQKIHCKNPYFLSLFIVIYLCIYMNILYLFQFHLSLENSLCKDYVTEKFWKVLPYNVIPIVLNGVDMSKIAPPHSYIDIKQFSSFQGLSLNSSFSIRATFCQVLPNRLSPYLRMTRCLLLIFGGESSTMPSPAIMASPVILLPTLT